MLILVTGWRYHPDEHAVYDVLDALWRPVEFGEKVLLIHGKCKTGGDEYASHWAMARGVPQKPFPAEDYGMWPWCGPKRNKAMVRFFKEHPDSNKVVVAFPQPDWETARVCGTRGCINEARKAGFEPRIYVATAVDR
jgi:hypothetical protein